MTHSNDLYDDAIFAQAEDSLFGITAILTSAVREDAASAILDAVAPLIAAKALRDFGDAFDTFDADDDNAFVGAAAHERADQIGAGR